jgi:hypothetical protein
MIKIKHVIITLYLALSVSLTYSQTLKDSSVSSISKFSMFREPSSILLGSGLGNLEPLLFEGNVAPYFMLAINKNARWGAELSTRIILRMYNEESYPIRTPSFIPKVTFFYHLVDSKNRKRDLFMYFSWFHHSNGQDGYFYNEDSVTINTHSGSFSTNWIEGGVYIARPDPFVPYTTNSVKVYVAYDYLQEVELNGTYGRFRYFLDLQNNVNLSKLFRVHRQSYNNNKMLLRQSLHVGWITGNLTDTKTIDSKRLILQYKLSFRPAFLNDVSVFLQYDYGEDYYNIFYNRSLNVVRIGIASWSNIFN